MFPRVVLAQNDASTKQQLPSNGGGGALQRDSHPFSPRERLEGAIATDQALNKDYVNGAASSEPCEGGTEVPPTRTKDS